jgi:hypothetical protein
MVDGAPVGAGRGGVRDGAVLLSESVDNAMSLFDPAATAKSVHDTIDEATKALPDDAKYAVIIDATARDGERPKVQGYPSREGREGMAGRDRRPDMTGRMSPARLQL